MAEPVDVSTAPDLACGEVRGGNEIINERFALPGLRGVLYSNPCRGTSGGDIHYLSVCGSGLLARVFIGDVAGHGETIAKVGAETHAHLRRSVDTIDERRVLTRLDRRLQDTGLDALTTAAIATYYPPSRRLTVSYAGHPPGWLCRREDRRWTRLDAEVAAPRGARFVDLPLGTGFAPAFTRRRFRMSIGDRLLFVTDGVLEATSPDGDPFGESGLEHLLRDGSEDFEALDLRLLAALRAHAGSHQLTHDDVTFLLAEIVPGPPGPALWHVFRNRVLSRVAWNATP
jgi:serine phosphatase RsbU (regulator of sigma subunit)